jgi:hypothetical protein
MKIELNTLYIPIPKSFIKYHQIIS